MKREKVTLSKLSIDEKLIHLRPINIMFVSRYRQAYRAGKDLGEIITDTDYRVVSGNHRVTALIEEYGPEHEIEVTVNKYDSEKDVLADFARHNVSHGNPLSGASRTAISMELIKAGMKREEVATLFGVSVKRIEDWGGVTVVVSGGVSGKTKHPQSLPAKRGVEPGTTMDSDQYRVHWEHDRGIPAESQANQLIRWIDNGWIKDPKAIRALASLRDAIDRLMAEVEVTA